jgi:hypothetical protein
MADSDRRGGRTGIAWRTDLSRDSRFGRLDAVHQRSLARKIIAIY